MVMTISQDKTEKEKLSQACIMKFILKMRVAKYAFLLVFLISLDGYVKSQSNLGMWNTFSLEKEFSKKFSAEIAEEFRLKNDISRLNLFYTNAGVSYKPIKRLKLSLIYRLTEKYSDENKFNYRNRLMFDVSYKYHFSDFVFCYRSRVQTEVINNKSHVPEWFWRDKFEIKYRFNKISPYIGTEFRYQIKVEEHPETDMGWHRVRVFAGIGYNINKNNVIEIYYLKQHEFYILDPNNLDIIGLGYSLTLPHKKMQ
jgi:hypothetical protein